MLRNSNLLYEHDKKCVLCFAPTNSNLISEHLNLYHPHDTLRALTFNNSKPLMFKSFEESQIFSNKNYFIFESNIDHGVVIIHLNDLNKHRFKIKTEKNMRQFFNITSFVMYSVLDCYINYGGIDSFVKTFTALSRFQNCDFLEENEIYNYFKKYFDDKNISMEIQFYKSCVSFIKMIGCNKTAFSIEFANGMEPMFHRYNYTLKTEDSSNFIRYPVEFVDFYLIHLKLLMLNNNFEKFIEFISQIHMYPWKMESILSHVYFDKQFLRLCIKFMKRNESKFVYLFKDEILDKSIFLFIVISYNCSRIYNFDQEIIQNLVSKIVSKEHIKFDGQKVLNWIYHTYQNDCSFDKAQLQARNMRYKLESFLLETC